MKKYLVTSADLKGAIEAFPIEVVQRMVDNQIEQGNKANVAIFQDLCANDVDHGGFDWIKTSEGLDFWRTVILQKQFDIFFKKYPKK